MDAELVTLATSGATTMVGLMATEVWTQARGRFAALFGRSRAADVEAELEEVRLAGDAPDELVAEWAPRLRRALAADDAMVPVLRELLAEFEPTARAEAGVHNIINGGTFHGPAIQAGSIGNLRL
ncbi:hypothetical protein [Kitasatospora sp. McL0602]|uniref:hypothetical protein n=1 Tax=Kitasatospora sp. McL0602 TaxID=3439530 RepID=UPI003F8B93CB